MKISRYDSMIDKSGAVYLRESGTFNIDGRRSYSSPDALAEFFGDAIGIRQAAEEHVYIACLDTKNHIVGCFEASHGSVNASMFPVREILQKSLMIGAVNIALSHNHPSGDYTPSAADVDATKRLKQACDICGINLLDHVIVAANNPGYFGFYENNMM